MVAKKNLRKLFYYTAFTLLSLATAALLVFAVQFYYSVPVEGDWNAMATENGIATTPTGTPLPGKGVGAIVDVTATTVAPITPVVPTTTVVPATPVVPTLPPVYKVVEEQPPQGSLFIPSLGIDQPLVTVPVKGKKWDLADLGAQVGWLETTGTRPGDDLAMVLIGHITLPPPGGPGPFLKLSWLRPGDRVEYHDGKTTYVYEVKSRTAVRPDQVDHLYVEDGSRLLLLTCTGYNALDRKYDLRLLVEAVLVRVTADHEQAR